MSENNHRKLLEVQGLTRRFPGVLALNQVDFDVRAGEVHALVGDRQLQSAQHLLDQIGKALEERPRAEGR